MPSLIFAPYGPKPRQDGQRPTRRINYKANPPYYAVGQESTGRRSVLHNVGVNHTVRVLREHRSWHIELDCNLARVLVLHTRVVETGRLEEKLCGIGTTRSPFGQPLGCKWKASQQCSLRSFTQCDGETWIVGQGLLNPSSQPLALDTILRILPFGYGVRALASRNCVYKAFDGLIGELFGFLAC